jgi:hypothetical protein
MPTDSLLRQRVWPRFALWSAGGLVLALLAWHHMPPRLNTGICRFEFANRTHWVITNLDLSFSSIDAFAGGKPNDYCCNFVRHFTNVAPGASVVVESNTPMLMLLDVEATHELYLPPPPFDAVFSGIGTFSGYDSAVVAMPGRSAALAFTGWNEFAPFYER